MTESPQIDNPAGRSGQEPIDTAILSILGLFASFLVLVYGLVMLRPGVLSRNWIRDQLKRHGEGPTWAEACQERLEVLVAANQAFGRRIVWIRVGILIQLFCGFVVFLVSLGY